MKSALPSGLIAALALAITLSAANAAPLRHHQAPRHVAQTSGDIYVHARSFLDPGPPSWFEAGTGDRYATDTTPSNFQDFGPPLSTNPGSYSVLPRRFDPPGRPEPLFVF